MAQDQFLQRPLYVFDLPPELLSSLVRKGDIHEQLANNPKLAYNVQVEEQDKISTTCGICSVAFKTAQEQREHAKSDFHKLNIKRKIRGLPVVKETEFERLLEEQELNESISGSDTEEEEGSEYGGTMESDVLLQKKKQREDGEPIVGKPKIGSPLHWFKSPLLPETVSLGIYKAIFSDQEVDDPIPALHRKQISTDASKSPHYFLCMIGGGHFAAMIVSLQPKLVKEQGGIDSRQAIVLAHKTFHRYTTRRKQGGSQASSDAAKGKAKSAGAQIRRYNEAELAKEVREILSLWKEYLDTAELLFIRAVGNTNRNTLFGQENPTIKRNDTRIRRFPFSTRRATQSELIRSFIELTRVKISRIDETLLTQATLELLSISETKEVVQKAPQKPSISKEKQELLEHTAQLQTLIRRSKAHALLQYLTTKSLSPNFAFYPPTNPQNHHAPNPLHLSASLNQPHIITALLTKAHADPTIVSPEGKLAFDLAGDRQSRDAFRVARHELGEDKWDWEKAHVPPPLPRKLVEERDAREKVEAEKVEEKRRKEELERLKKVTMKESKTKGLTLGNGVAVRTGLEKREEETRGLTPEAKMKLERERRARAAEERIKRMQASG